MNVNFLVAPQWQGSGSTRALQLGDGAEVIRGDLPASRTSIVDIPLGAGESLGSGIRRFSAIQSVRERIAEILQDLDGPVITIGGDCGVDLAPIVHAHSAHPNDLAVIWFDAHPDVNSSETSPSGAFHGMVLRTLLGEGFPSLVPENPVPLANVVLAGTRSFDEAEAEWIKDRGIRTLSVDDLNPDSLVTAIVETGASAVYLHIDLDVLDPAEFMSLGFPEPFGITVGQLLETVRAVTERFTFAGAGICEFAPPNPDAATDDLPTILRIIGALTA